MKTGILAAAFAALTISFSAQAQTLTPSPTLDAIKARGHLECGVHLGLPGFSFANDKGEWTGIDVDYCKALAAAILGDANKVKFTPTSVQQRWPILQSGQVDLLSRNTTITFSRNASLGVNFQGINFYEGQTFVVRKKAGITKPDQMDGATICVAAGSSEEKQATDWFAERKKKVTIVNFQKNDDAIAAYDAERCDAYTAGFGALAGQRIKLKSPDDNVILTELISNDPQGPTTRYGDERFQAVVRWVLNGMIAAEALGVTSANVDQMKASSPNPEVRRLLGAEGNFGAMLGLSNDWMYQAIKQVGNYAESYERTVGMGSPLKLPRGPNQLWTKGGLLFTPPFQ
jgi:general L-amino acid transport system substrate-binding protein